MSGENKGQISQVWSAKTSLFLCDYWTGAPEGSEQTKHWRGKIGLKHAGATVLHERLVGLLSLLVGVHGAVVQRILLRDAVLEELKHLSPPGKKD